MKTEMKELIKLLPEGYEKACFETKAITRKRTIADPKDLFVLLLYYLYENHSLVDTSQFAFMCGIGNISDVAFMKRFLKCHDWIRWMIEHMLPAEIIHYQKPKELEPYRLLAVDASSITKKGAVQYSWHLHYAVDIFTLSCNQFLRTDQSVGESMENFDIEKGDLVLGDRAYGSIKSIRHCLEHGGDFILRIRNKAFQMYDENRNKIILSDWLKTVSSRAVDKKVYVKTAQKEWIPLRICAVRKSEEQIKKEEKRMKRNGLFRMNLVLVFALIAGLLLPVQNVNAASKKKVLVVYFSATGNTEDAAKDIRKATGGKLYEIKAADPYTEEDDAYTRCSTSW